VSVLVPTAVGFHEAEGGVALGDRVDHAGEHLGAAMQPEEAYGQVDE